jgi:ATP adenylyltransferase
VIKNQSSYQKLIHFITHEMRMSHIYQPVMLKALLASDNGRASVTEIAKALLAEDRAQIEYYEYITKNMVGKVLTKNRGITDKDGDYYDLLGFEDLTEEERAELIWACELRLQEYLEKRGDAPWQHRKKSSGYISGSKRYEVLKRAHFLCELCGISADQKALEVDHILPRNKGGSDEIANLQVLCYSCNAMKRDTDDTDFRGMAESYKLREAGCIFCEMPADRVIKENELCYAIRDGYPVTEMHTLVIPKRHVADYFDLHQPERNAIEQLIHELRTEILSTDRTVTGFNVGINAGRSAGQTIFHVHVHLIPRRDGDMAEPRGGVRGVIPEKQKY